LTELPPRVWWLTFWEYRA